MMALHADTTAAPVESTTVMVIVGIAGTFLGGGGWGVALRGEHQVTNRTAIGIELTGGTGDEAHTTKDDKAEYKHELFAFRGYGRFSPRAHDWLALHYGAGLTLMDTGLVSFTAHAGGAVAYTNDSISPVLQLGLATSLPLRDGRPFGDRKKLADQDLFLTVDVGLLGTPEDARLSVDFGFAGAVNSGELVFSASAGGGTTF